MEHLRKVLPLGLLEELEPLVEDYVQFRSAPRWLGNFGLKMYGRGYGRDYGKPFPLLLEALQLLRGAILKQTFTTVFLQRYQRGSEVFPHRDPKNNIGYTAIAPFGDFEGAVNHVDGHPSVVIPPGDALILPCTINDVQGPKHSVSRVLSGTRYALILNTLADTPSPSWLT